MIKESDKMYELPYFPGTRVCLNPESSIYKNYMRDTEGTAGYVVDLQLSDLALANWARHGESTKKMIFITVKWDNGSIFNIQHQDVLPVDSKPVDVIVYHFTNGVRICAIKGDTKINQTLDKLIIQEGLNIKNTIEYTSEWRAKMTQIILNQKQSESDLKPLEYF